jgi:mono/diheme cytochrome c family protein|tara:strand:+ start:232 stop:543 length:312 start_codon:yes stop_codon:yes gene_type:complete
MKKNNFFYTLIVISILFFIPVKADQKFDLGKDLFLNNCAVCHTLLDAQSSGNIGPNLDELRPDKMRIMRAVTTGIGVMPPFEGALSSEDIEAVAHYVSITFNN